MKTKLTSLLLIIAFGLVSFFSAKADTNSSIKISEKSSGIVLVRYVSSTKVSTKVSILDENKKIVFSEKVSGKNGVARVYNITALPEGEYFFEVLENGNKVVKSITYKKEIINIPNKLQVNVSPSALPGKYELICKSLSGNFAISIYSKSEGLVFEDVISNTKGFKRVYDLSKLKAGDYVFEVKNGSNVISKEISLVKSELSLN